MQILLAFLVLSTVAPVRITPSSKPDQNRVYDAKPFAGIASAALYVEFANLSAADPRISQQPNEDGQPVRVVSMPDKDRFDRFAAYVNGGLFIVGAAGVFIALFTLITLSRSSERQLRAYVFPTDIFMTDGTTLTPPEPQRIGVPGVALIFRNTGQTPAYRVRTWAQIDVIPIQNEGQLGMPPMQDISSHTLGAGGTSNKALWYDRALNAAEIAEIAQGTRGIYVHGRIEYKDVFKTQRFATFRLVFTGKGFPPTGSSYFTFCNNGNDAN